MFLRSFSRNFSAAASRTMATTSSPFTKVVVEAMRKLYPEKLADSSFDNTGLLLEAPHVPHLNNSVLLTVDLTKAVAEEAIARKDSIIITYHPIIFRPLKAMTLGNTQQSSLLRLAQEGISVYSPHTAVDAAVGGLNDWLADMVSAKSSPNSLFPSKAGVAHRRDVITPVTGLVGSEGAGYGRIVRFEEPQKLGKLLDQIMNGLGSLNALSLAVPQSVPTESKLDIPISSVAICAGSGGSILNGLDVDMFFTGELAHHEALAAIEQGRVVVTTFHSNSERAFLTEVMHPALIQDLEQTLAGMPHDVAQDIRNFHVEVSQADRDPFETVIRPKADRLLLNIRSDIN